MVGFEYVDDFEEEHCVVIDLFILRVMVFW
jgi:hypothetical protein